MGFVVVVTVYWDGERLSILQESHVVANESMSSYQRVLRSSSSFNLKH